MTVILCTLNYYGAGSVLHVCYMHQVQMDFCENFKPSITYCNMNKLLSWPFGVKAEKLSKKQTALLPETKSGKMKYSEDNLELKWLYN